MRLKRRTDFQNGKNLKLENFLTRGRFCFNLFQQKGQLFCVGVGVDVGNFFQKKFFMNKVCSEVFEKCWTFKKLISKISHCFCLVLSLSLIQTHMRTHTHAHTRAHTHTQTFPYKFKHKNTNTLTHSLKHAQPHKLY